MDLLYDSEGGFAELEMVLAKLAHMLVCVERWMSILKGQFDYHLQVFELII